MINAMTDHRLNTLALAMAAAAAALFIYPSVASADVCDGQGLEGKYLKRCETALAKCKNDHGKARAACEKRAVSNAKSGQSRDSSASKRAPDGGGVCTSESYTKTCFSLKERRDLLCKRSMLIRLDSYEDGEHKKQVEAMRAQLKSYVELAPDYAAFNVKYGKCSSARGVRCTLPAADSSCDDAKAVYVKAWADYVDLFDKTRLAEMAAELKKVKKERGATVTGFNKTMDRGAREGATIAAINRDFSWIAVKQRRVDDLAKRAKAMQAEVEAIYEKRIANVRCPRAKVKNRGLTSKLQAVTVEHLAGLEKRGTGMKETVVRFGLMGKGKTTRVPSKRLTHEDVPATTCVKQVKPARTACRIFNVTLRRTKPDGGAWGSWGFYSIGGGELMSCKNLK